MTDIFTTPEPLQRHGVTISLVTMRNVQALSRAVAPIINELLEVIEGSGDMLALLAEHTDKLCAVLACCSDATPDQIADMAPDVFVDLIACVVEINASFFIQRLMPMIRDRLQGVTAALQTATTGQTLSPA